MSFVSFSSVLTGSSCQIYLLLVENARDGLVNVDAARTVSIDIFTVLTNKDEARRPIGLVLFPLCLCCNVCWSILVFVVETLVIG